MTEEDKIKIISNDYADLIVENSIEADELSAVMPYVINRITQKYSTIYFPANMFPYTTRSESGYSFFPNMYGLLDTSALEDMGVIGVQNTPFLALRGQDVLLGFVDTGIDYTRNIFKYADNTTRIVSIWDQTTENLQAQENTFYYGTEYPREQLNLALQNEAPLTIVPSTDEIGHGTALAGLAGGSFDETGNFSGVVPLSEFIIVKLKRAKPFMKEISLIPEDAIAYQENDIMFGIQYIINTARALNRPVAICIGIGSTQGGHDGRGSLQDMISTLANEVGNVFTIAAGNEGNRGHHYYGEIDRQIGYDTVELNVGEGEPGFSMELWGNIPGIYSVDIQSPSGEYIPRIPARVGEFRDINFLFDRTNLLINYFLVEAQSGDQLILFRFRNPAPGIWRFRVYAGPNSSGFHIWLPLTGFITDNTMFFSPDPDTTITNPSDTAFAITATAYSHSAQSLYLNASRGFTRTNIVKPELTAPGVNVYSPMPGNTFGYRSGTSISAALTTGLAAMLLEWGIIKGNNRAMDSIEVKKYLIRGVKRVETMVYPNTQWGYGIVDIYGTYISLRGEI